MARGLSSTIKNILSSDNFIYTDILELHFPTPFFFIDGPHDMTITTPTSSGAKLYEATGEWLGYNNVSETGQPRIQTVTIALSGINNTFTNLFLNNSYVNTRAVIYRIFVNANHVIQGSPVMIWDSEITSYTITDSEKTTQVDVKTSSVFFDFEKTRGRRTNNPSQQAFHPGDKGFEFATVDTKDIRWGKKV